MLPPGATDATRGAGPFQASILPGILFALALVFLTIRLEVPPRYIFDEVYHAYTAGQYVAGNHDAYVWDTTAPRKDTAYTWNHPPAGVLMIAGGILLWGDTPYGWRFASAVFGAVGIVVFYVLALRITRKRSVAALAAGLLLTDGLYVVQSRTGMLDIFGTVFMMGAFLSLYDYLTAPPERVRGPLLRTGALLGLAIATKWNAAYPAAFIGLVTLIRAALLWRASRTPGALPATAAGLRAHLVWIPLALGALPVAVYLAAYIPFFWTGHDLSKFVELQKQTLYYHTHLTATHNYQSRWWQWPLTLRPVWYHVLNDENGVANIYANGNPILYWAFIPSVLAVLYLWIRRQEPAWVVLAIGFFGQWLPWALVPRIAFAYHFLPAATFGTFAVAVVLYELASRGGAARVVAGAYLAAIVAAFVFFYPIYTAIPLTRAGFEHRMWIESWR
jgi:dolichyl-phosphate-mannose--protein O-mannosyl transferase